MKQHNSKIVEEWVDYLEILPLSMKLHMDKKLNELDMLLVRLKETAHNVENYYDFKQQAHTYLTKNNNVSMYAQMCVTLDSISTILAEAEFLPGHALP